MESNQERIIERMEKAHEKHFEKEINCIKCYPTSYLRSRPEYVKFWEWISTNYGAIIGTGATERYLYEITKNKTIRENEGEMRTRIANLLISITYDGIIPSWTSRDIDKVWNELKSRNYFEQEPIETQIPRSNVSNIDESHEELEEKHINMTPIPTSLTKITQKFIEEINFENKNEQQEEINYNQNNQEEIIFENNQSDQEQINFENDQSEQEETNSEDNQEEINFEDIQENYEQNNFQRENMNAEEFQLEVLQALRRLGNPERNIATPTSFKGSIEEDPIEWLKNFNSVARANNWTDETKFGVLRTCLKGNALNWYEEREEEFEERWKNPHRRNDDEYNEDENGFEEKFIKRFTTREMKNLWFHKFNTIEQGPDESVSSYTGRFYNILKKVEIDGGIPDGLTFQRYLSGLRSEIAEKLVEYDVQELEEMVNRAKNIERGKKYNKEKAINNPFLKGYKKPTKEDDQIAELTEKMRKLELNLAQRNTKKSEVKCFKCGKYGHYKGDCTEEVKCELCGKETHATKQCFKNYECNICNRKGHTAKFCRENVRTVNYVEEDDKEIYYDESEDELYYVTKKPKVKFVDEDEAYIGTRSGLKYNEKKPRKVQLKTRKIKIKDDDAMDIDDERVKVRKIKEPSKIDKIRSYNIVEDLEEIRSNITLAQILQDPKQIKLLKEALKRKEHQELAEN